MAYTQKYSTKRYGDRYRSFFKGTDGWESSRTDEFGNPFLTDQAAQDWGDAQEVDVRRGVWRDPALGKLTLQEWVDRWWPAQDITLGTRRNYSNVIQVHTLPAFGHRALDSLSPVEIAQWELGIIAAGYKPNVAKAARDRLITILGDAVLEGLIQANPALRPRRRGRKRKSGGQAADKVWVEPITVLLLGERMALLGGRDEDFVTAQVLGYTGMRFGEWAGTDRAHLKLGSIDIQWQLFEDAGQFYRQRPKDESMREADLPPFLANLLSAIVASSPSQKCQCAGGPPAAGGELPCEGGRPYVWLGPDLGHPRMSNYGRRVWRPAADGMHSADGSRSKARPVLVDATRWPGVPLPPWPAAVPGEPFVPPPLAGYQRRAARLGINAASSRAQLVTYASAQGVDDAEQLTRSEILDRFLRSAYVSEATPLASWAPLAAGLTPHGLRHGHKTWMAEDGIPEILQADRLGHTVPGMRGVYTHISSAMRAELKSALQKRWEQALAMRAGISLHSPVAILDRLLEPFRIGRQKPIYQGSTNGSVNPIRMISG